MAQIEHVQTGSRVETHVRGRVFRYAPQLPKQQRPASKERRRICVLSHHTGRLMEHWGYGEECHGPTCHHTHLTREAVDQLVRDGVLKYIGTGRNVASYSFGRVWKGMPSGNERVKVMQLV
jgi:hypothetical protein